jgi:hypothetical protein
VKPPSLAERHDRAIDFIEDEIRLLRALQDVDRWPGVVEQWKRITSLVEEGLSLAIGAKSEHLTKSAETT